MPLTLLASRTLPVLVLVGAATIGLASTNPNPAEFESFAADQLTRLVTDELCNEDGLPLMLRLVIRDCPALVQSQNRALGRLARQHTRRRNFGILSFYFTDMGGQKILPNLRLPRYSALTLGAAGRFVVVQSDQTDSSVVEP